MVEKRKQNSIFFMGLALIVISTHVFASGFDLRTYRMDQKVMNLMRSHISPKTQLPYSYFIPQDFRQDVFENMGRADRVEDIIERVIVNEGLVVYDGAVGQIVWAMSGTRDDLALASKPIETYWKGRLGEIASIRAGHGFVYDPDNPQAISSNLDQKGMRGFIYRIINADGKYATADPLDGKTEFEGFPSFPTVHWEDWKPVAGENAWVVMAALHLYHTKYFDETMGLYDHHEEALELKLAEEIARAALLLKADNGGIRMAPIGTYRHPRDCPDDPSICYEKKWWYYQISSENNLSWYSAFRMLYEITGKEKYREAMEGIGNYFKQVWNDEEKYFYQGMNFSDGQWHVNDDHFALDVQTWGIACLGPRTIDEWFGDGTVFEIWKKSLEISGAHGEEDQLLGVGYTNENDRISVEWTAGAILAAWEAYEYYQKSHPYEAGVLLTDMHDMRDYMESLRMEIDGNKAAYSYSSRRGWIPFGWNSHQPEVLSLASTGWMVFVDNRFNPFFLDGDLDYQG